MARIHAARIVAVVADERPVRNGAVRQQPCHAMRLQVVELSLPAQGKLAVWKTPLRLPIRCRCPQPAAIRSPHLWPEPPSNISNQPIVSRRESISESGSVSSVNFRHWRVSRGKLRAIYGQNPAGTKGLSPRNALESRLAPQSLSQAPNWDACFLKATATGVRRKRTVRAHTRTVFAPTDSATA